MPCEPNDRSNPLKAHRYLTGRIRRGTGVPVVLATFPEREDLFPASVVGLCLFTPSYP